jgi:hypothetical protein
MDSNRASSSSYSASSSSSSSSSSSLIQPGKGSGNGSSSALDLWIQVKDYIALTGSQGCLLSTAFEFCHVDNKRLKGLLYSMIKSRLKDWVIEGPDASLSMIDIATICSTTKVIAPMYESMKAFGWQATQQELLPQILSTLELLGAARDKGCTALEIGKHLKTSKVHHVVDKLAAMNVVTKRVVRAASRGKVGGHFTRNIVLHLKRFAAEYIPIKYGFVFEVSRESKMLILVMVHNKLLEHNRTSMRIADVALLIGLTSRDMIDLREFIESCPSNDDIPVRLEFFQGNDEESGLRCWFVGIPEANESMGQSKLSTGSRNSSLKTEKYDGDSKALDNDEEQEEGLLSMIDSPFGSGCLQNQSFYGQLQLTATNHLDSGLSGADLQHIIGMNKKKAARVFGELVNIFQFPTKKVQRGKNVVNLIQKDIVISLNESDDEMPPSAKTSKAKAASRDTIDLSKDDIDENTGTVESFKPIFKNKTFSMLSFAEVKEWRQSIILEVIELVCTH